MLLKHESLAQMALFAGLSDSEVQALAQRSVERRFAAEEMLFWEGEPCTGIFLLTQGSVKIFKTSAAGREMMLSLETAPSSVAELPLFDGGPYPASVRAVGPVLALFINKSDFHQVCRQFPDVALKLLAVVGRRLRHLVGVVESMTFGSVTQRLARLLLDASLQARGQTSSILPLTHRNWRRDWARCGKWCRAIWRASARKDWYRYRGTSCGLWIARVWNAQLKLRDSQWRNIFCFSPRLRATRSASLPMRRGGWAWTSRSPPTAATSSTIPGATAPIAVKFDQIAESLEALRGLRVRWRRGGGRSSGGAGGGGGGAARHAVPSAGRRARLPR